MQHYSQITALMRWLFLENQQHKAQSVQSDIYIFLLINQKYTSQAVLSDSYEPVILMNKNLQRSLCSLIPEQMTCMFFAVNQDTAQPV